MDQSLTKEQLLETFINCGFLVQGSGLEGLEKAVSLSGLLGDLCHSLDNQSSTSPLLLVSGSHHFSEGNFLIGALLKPRLQRAEFLLQQHFRWMSLRWDREPLHGLLGRHLRQKLLHQRGTGPRAPKGLT